MNKLLPKRCPIIVVTLVTLWLTAMVPGPAHSEPVDNFSADLLTEVINKHLEQINESLRTNNSGFLKGRVEDYEQLLTQLRKNLKNQEIGREEFVDRSFETIIDLNESYLELREKLGDKEEKSFEKSQEDYEDVNEDEDARKDSGLQWLEDYQEKQSNYDFLHLNHRIIMDLYGQVIALTLSETPKATIKVYLQGLENQFRSVTKITLSETKRESLPFHLYGRYVNEIGKIISSNKVPAERNNFIYSLENHWRILRELANYDANRQTRDLLETIDSRLEELTGREKTLRR